MRRVGLVLAYDGGDFAGWQVQPDRRTVQGVVAAALTTLTGSDGGLHGASRTDTGVHALGQVAHADLAESVPHDASTLQHRLNALLPADVRVRAVAEMDTSFHARKHAVGKTYRYRWHVARVHDPMARTQAHHVGWDIDLDATREAAVRFVGKHDFAALQSAGSSVESSVRTLTRCEILGEPPDVRLEVEGDGFLRHMVRAIVGCLFEIGAGRRPVEWIDDVIASRDRSAAGPNAPACGLVLVRVRHAEPHASRLDDALAEQAAPRPWRAVSESPA